VSYGQLGCAPAGAVWDWRAIAAVA
jgi:hypothetical protein